MKVTFDLNDAIPEKKVGKSFYAPEGFRRLTINLDENLHKEIKLRAIKEDVTVTDIISKLLKKELQKK
jgi:hypothetical protein